MHHHLAAPPPSDSETKMHTCYLNQGFRAQASEQHAGAGRAASACVCAAQRAGQCSEAGK